MLNFLESKLYSDVEGTCSGEFGYIIAVVSILDIGKGMVLAGSGQAEFVTRYRAIVFKPFKGQVVDGVVNNVTKVRVFYQYCLGVGANEARRVDGLLCGRWAFDCVRVAPGEYCSRYGPSIIDRLIDGNISLVRSYVAHPSRHEIRPKFESSFLRVGRAGQYWSYARVSSLRRASRSSRRTQESA